ncbi:unnamed protein product [Echinostoma caproni]|uniref:Vps5 domain-containing protein n=1 Tax=Echinostoma caproni TaxID=27848 RepID=A0A183B665_9TREM|nr:unnamed protein product [Echinostoma caproni]
MQSKAEGQNANKVLNLINENAKIKGKLDDYEKAAESSFEAVEMELTNLRSLFEDAETLSDELKKAVSNFASTVRTKMSEYIKAHREVHPAVSKYGKLIDKVCLSLSY